MKSFSVSFVLRSVTFTLAATALVACNDSDDPDVTTYGTAQSLGNGSARSFVTLDSAGAPRAIGLTISEGALTGLPTSGDTPTVLSLPAQAVSATVFDHVSLDWEAMGHEPPGLYDRPHFDMHFYLISQAQRQSIAFAPDEPPPPAEAIAEGYASARAVVPGMGQHWFDPTDSNNTPGSFSNTFIYGYNKSRMVFLEPMITRTLLQSRKDVSADIKQPKVYPKPGYYPTHYSVHFDDATKTYIITLDGMVRR